MNYDGYGFPIFDDDYEDELIEKKTVEPEKEPPKENKKDKLEPLF